MNNIEYFLLKLGTKQEGLISLLNSVLSYVSIAGKKECYKGRSKTINICGHHDYVCRKPYKIYTILQGN